MNRLLKYFVVVLAAFFAGTLNAQSTADSYIFPIKGKNVTNWFQNTLDPRTGSAGVCVDNSSAETPGGWYARNPFGNHWNTCFSGNSPGGASRPYHPGCDLNRFDGAENSGNDEEVRAIASGILIRVSLTTHGWAVIVRSDFPNGATYDLSDYVIPGTTPTSVIQNATGIVTMYQHLYDNILKPGDSNYRPNYEEQQATPILITKGQLIGHIDSGEGHLHFEMRAFNAGVPYNEASATAFNENGSLSGYYSSHQRITDLNHIDGMKFISDFMVGRYPDIGWNTQNDVSAKFRSAYEKAGGFDALGSVWDFTSTSASDKYSLVHDWPQSGQNKYKRQVFLKIDRDDHGTPTNYADDSFDYTWSQLVYNPVAGDGGSVYLLSNEYGLLDYWNPSSGHTTYGLPFSDRFPARFATNPNGTVYAFANVGDNLEVQKFGDPNGTRKTIAHNKANGQTAYFVLATFGFNGTSGVQWYIQVGSNPADDIPWPQAGVTTPTGRWVTVPGWYNFVQHAGNAQNGARQGGLTAQLFEGNNQFADPSGNPPSNPVAVTNLSASSVTASSVTLTWTDPNDPDASSYQINRDGVAIGLSSTTSFTDGTVMAGRSYSYSVSVNNGPESSPISVTTDEGDDDGSPGSIPHVLDLNSYLLDFGYSDSTRLLIVMNANSQSGFSWTATPSESWITLSRTSGTASSYNATYGYHDSIMVTINRSALTDSTQYQESIGIGASGGNQTMPVIVEKNTIFQGPMTYSFNTGQGHWIIVHDPSGLSGLASSGALKLVDDAETFLFEPGSIFSEVHMKAVFDNGSSEARNQITYFYVNYQDATHHYYWEFQEDSRVGGVQTKLYKNNGQLSTLWSSGYDAGTYYLGYAQGLHYLLNSSGDTLASVVDSTISSGRLGLWVNEETTLWDQIIVSTDPITISSSSDSTTIEVIYDTRTNWTFDADDFEVSGSITVQGNANSNGIVLSSSTSGSVELVPAQGLRDVSITFDFDSDPPDGWGGGTASEECAIRVRKSGNDWFQAKVNVGYDVAENAEYENATRLTSHMAQYWQTMTAGTYQITARNDSLISKKLLPSNEAFTLVLTDVDTAAGALEFFANEGKIYLSNLVVENLSVAVVPDTTEEDTTDASLVYDSSTNFSLNDWTVTSGTVSISAHGSDTGITLNTTTSGFVKLIPAEGLTNARITFDFATDYPTGWGGGTPQEAGAVVVRRSGNNWYQAKVGIGYDICENAEYANGSRNTSHMQQLWQNMTDGTYEVRVSNDSLIAKKHLPANEAFTVILTNVPETAGDIQFFAEEGAVHFTNITVIDLDALGKRTASDVQASSLPTKYALHQCYPNPFNPSAIIRFDLPEAQDVSITIYNVMGQRVRTLVDRQHSEAGFQQTIFDGKDGSGRMLPTGVYFYRIEAGEFRSVRKMTLVK